jgi:hypothetical protein
MTNKTLKQIQEESRKAIIMACHPEAKSYEEALEMELNNQVPCAVKIKYKGNDREYDRLIFYTLKTETNDELVEMGGERIHRKFMSRIIGGQLTLNRVLIVLKNEFYFYKQNNFLKISELNQDPNEQIEWDLTKETLEEQSEETQKEINKLLNEV